MLPSQAGYTSASVSAEPDQKISRKVGESIYVIGLPLQSGLMLKPAQHTTKPMETSDTTQTRLTELEIKLSYTEHQLEQLDAVVIRQQQQIDALLAEVRRLREAGTSETQPGQRSLRDELPPHY